MAIKRKTQLNLSGSHRTLDSDNAFVGGFAYVTGSLTASTGLYTTGILEVRGPGALPNPNAIIVVVTGGIDATGPISGSVGRFTYLSGALSASSTGQPFIVAGSNITANWSDTNLNWEITGSGGGGSVAGANTEVQFNADGAFGASSVLTFYTASVGNIDAGTFSAPTASFTHALFVSGVNVTPITRLVTTTLGSDLNVPSADFLSFKQATGGSDFGNRSIVAFDFTIVAVVTNDPIADEYASWNFTATGIKDSGGATKLIDYLEVSQGSSGSEAATWDVNVYDDLSVGLTGSISYDVNWFMKASIKAGLSTGGGTY